LLIFLEFLPWLCQTKNLAVAPRHAPFRRCAQAAELYRGQGFRRIAPSASHRPETGMYKGRQVLKVKTEA